MGIFDERIKKKNRLEDEMFVEAFQKLAGVVVGQKAENALESERLRMLSVMEELGKSLNISIPYASNPEPTVEWYQEHYFRPQGIMWRSVRLKENWYEDAAGVMLGFLKDGRPVALIPAWDRGCFYKDLDSGRRMRVTSALAEQFQEEAILYYRPLPEECGLRLRWRSSFKRRQSCITDRCLCGRSTQRTYLISSVPRFPPANC